MRHDQRVGVVSLCSHDLLSTDFDSRVEMWTEPGLQAG